MAPWPCSSLLLSVPVSELEKSVRDQDCLLCVSDGFSIYCLLCVSDGFSIYCLDLDRIGKDCFGYPETLPLISTINLFEEHYPISAALFQLGPLGLMIGGKEIPDFKQPTDHLMSPYDIVYKYGFEGSSKEIYQLFLVDGNLRLSCYNGIPFPPLENPKSWHKPMPLLKNPKSWPIVEKIDNHLHVIESIPLCFDPNTHGWIPSHEVLDLDDVDHGWTEVSPMGIELFGNKGSFMFMSDELVLGDRMFAVLLQPGSFSEFYDLDCKSNKKCWEFHQGTFDESRFHASQLLNQGSYICVGRFDKPVLCYAVIGFIYDCFEEGDDWFYAASAMAFLATPTGEVICHQSLPEFFDGVVRIFDPVSTVFCDDFDTSSRSTFCVVLMGDCYDSTDPDLSGVSVLYISTFCVEEANLDCLSVSGKDEERNFLKIRLMKKQVYKLGQKLRSLGDTFDTRVPPPRLSACFFR